MDLDHVFICVDDPSTAQQVLVDFGLQFGLHAVHQGQGTANACAFFDNAYLELLWRHDERELQSEVVRPLALFERVRWRHTGASPFGIAFRPRGDDDHPNAWHYPGPFLPPGATITILTPPHSPDDPLVFLIPTTLPIRVRSPAAHRGQRRTVTRITVCGPRLSEHAMRLPAHHALEVFELRDAATHHLELEWDRRRGGESHDFRPRLPLTIYW